MRRKTKADSRRKTQADARRKTQADVPRTTDVWYVYGFVRPGFDASKAPAGLDDVPVTVTQTDKAAALVSRLPTSGYAAEAVERNTADVSWLSPRAVAHDRVLTWAQEHGGVLPLPMFSLWRSERALSQALTKRATELRRVFGRVADADEFGVRVYRRDDAMLQAIDAIDPELATLRREAEASPPGQRYLLERKLADHAKQTIRAAARRMAQQVFEALGKLARASLARPLVPDGRPQEATLVLNGAFLVDRSRLDEFRAAVGEHVRTLQPRGLAFDFTGPWPPYNFVGDQKAKPRKGKAR